MEWTPITLETWNRKEYFEHFLHAVPCTYSVTATLDITALRERKSRVYPAMLYLIAQTVNRHPEFCTALDSSGQLGIFIAMHPCYTIFHRDTETFSNLWTEYHPDYSVFLQSYQEDLRNYGNIHRMNAKPHCPANTFPVSMIPWCNFTGFQLNLQKGYDYLLPIFTMGQFTNQDGRTMLPISVQVHHAVCDGFHVSRFLNELQESLHTWQD